MILYKEKKLCEWWLRHRRPECPIPMDYIDVFLKGDMENIRQSESVEIIKTSKSSRIVRLRHDKKSVIVKIFHRHKFKDKLRGRPSGLAEYRNLTEAAKRKIGTPDCYLYFEKRYLGILKYRGIVMEDMRDYKEFEKLYADGQCTYFDVIPLIHKLYANGVNHIDFSPRNVFINANKSDFAVIDWQYSSFYPMPDPVSLCMMAAVFLRYAGIQKEAAIWGQWLNELHRQCRPNISAQKLHSAVAVMQNRKLHWKSRLRLDIRELGIEPILQEKD
jgi:tRNA A-37 threonylcarbamoyl transferase component Bud32